jgi:hypothetical protein
VTRLSQEQHGEVDWVALFGKIPLYPPDGLGGSGLGLARVARTKASVSVVADYVSHDTTSPLLGR